MLVLRARLEAAHAEAAARTADADHRVATAHAQVAAIVAAADGVRAGLQAALAAAVPRNGDSLRYPPQHDGRSTLLSAAQVAALDTALAAVALSRPPSAAGQGGADAVTADGRSRPCSVAASVASCRDLWLPEADALGGGPRDVLARARSARSAVAATAAVAAASEWRGPRAAAMTAPPIGSGGSRARPGDVFLGMHSCSASAAAPSVFFAERSLQPQRPPPPPLAAAEVNTPPKRPRYPPAHRRRNSAGGGGVGDAQPDRPHTAPPYASSTRPPPLQQQPPLLLTGRGVRSGDGGGLGPGGRRARGGGGFVWKQLPPPSTSAPAPPALLALAGLVGAPQRGARSRR